MSFEQATEYVRSLPKDGPIQLDSAAKLKFYGLFKQATEGDNTGAQPWAVQIEARSKYDAWAERKGMSADDAKTEYVRLLTEVTKSNDVDWTADLPK